MEGEIKKEKDAYGHHLLEYLEDRKSYEIIERDDNFIEIPKGAPEYFAKYDCWEEYEKKAMKFVKGKVFDIGCGAGRNSLYLQKKGFDVLGVDNSPLAVKVCKRRGLKKVKTLAIENIDQLKEKFDTIIMLGSNFGLFGSFNKAKRLLKKMDKITSPNAIIIADTADPYKTKDKNHLDYHKLNKRRGRMPGQLRIRSRFKKIVGDWFDYLLVSKREMKKILEGTGWSVKKFINSNSAAYMAIIEKKLR